MMATSSNYKSLFFTAFVIQIANVMSASENGEELTEDSKKCKGMFNLFRKDCTRKCPKTFPPGICLKLPKKWTCLCGNDDNIHSRYTEKEAKKIYKVCNNEVRDHGGCRKLCPKNFHHGSCDKLDGIWQCVCKQEENAVARYTSKEANIMQKVCNSKRNLDIGCKDLCPPGFIGYCAKLDNHVACHCGLQESNRQTPFLHTIPLSKSMYRTCNSEAQKYTLECKQFCTSNFNYGGCIEENGSWECRCSQPYFRHDWYSVSDAGRINQACHVTGQEEGCSELCPAGFSGHCVDLPEDVKTCVCKRLPEEDGWLTVRRVQEMGRVCNSENNLSPESDAGCYDLCPLTFLAGKCVEREGFFECACKESEDVWVSLSHAIATAVRRTVKGKQRARFS